MQHPNLEKIKKIKLNKIFMCVDSRENDRKAMTKLIFAGQKAPGAAAPAAWVLPPPPRQRGSRRASQPGLRTERGNCFVQETLCSPQEGAASACPVFHFDLSVLRLTKAG